MGIKTVAVYSEADRESMHTMFADEAVCIGPAAGSESYLKVTNIISAASVTGAEAIHPGYGFLAENAEFSEICSESNIKFIGPSPDMINKMGDKAYAKTSMKKVGVPVVPGSDGEIDNIEEAKRVAAEVGYPVMLKATAGGGGKGMRIVENESEIEMAFQTASTEAGASFGNPALYLEKFIENPRHVEIQIMGDSFGNVYAYAERDCSVQRRHQKLIEETPSPIVDEELRAKMVDAAIKGAKAVNYEGAGTVEFLVDKYRNFYFIEMNTRIQVEHPITEMVHNIDLIKNQILVAAGEKITDVPQKPFGHCFEFRINAEDPEFDFRPSPGKISMLHFPGGFGIRNDSHVYSGYVIPPYYDSLLGKLIVWGVDRNHAIARAKRAFEEFLVEGIKTTIPFHREVLENEDFITSNYDTSFIDKMLKNKVRKK